MSVRVPGPVMVASGCGGTGRELLPYLQQAGQDADDLDFVTRSLTLDPRPGASSTAVVEVPGGILHATERPNPGVDHFLATELPWLVRAGLRVHVSVAGSTLGEVTQLVRRVSHAPGVAGIEVEVGAPDAPGSGAYDAREPVHAAALVAAVRRELGADRPVLAKLRPDVARVVEAARACADAGASAVVVGSALPAAMPDRRPGGLSGPAIAPVTRRSVIEVVAHLPGLPVVACGGVDGPAAARAYLADGAVAVQVGSALLRDPTVVARVRAGLQTAAGQDDDITDEERT